MPGACDIMEGMSGAFDLIGTQNKKAFADGPGQVAAAGWLIDHLRGERTVLDVGCGGGQPTARQLADAGCQVVGVDTAPAMLELARKNVPEGIFVERDLHDLGGLHPRQHRFDGAVAFFSMQMLDEAGIGKVLDAIRNVLAADGLFVMGVRVSLTAYARDELADLLSHHGFTVRELHTVSGELSELFAYCAVTPVM